MDAPQDNEAETRVCPFTIGGAGGAQPCIRAGCMAWRPGPSERAELSDIVEFTSDARQAFAWQDAADVARRQGWSPAPASTIFFGVALSWIRKDDPAVGDCVRLAQSGPVS